MPLQRTHRVLEWLTQQSAQAPATPEYGSWLLGRVSESQRRRRIRIQIILTVFVVVANLIGVAVAMSVITFAIPVPNIFEGRARPIITIVAPPVYVGVAVIIGWIWATRRVLDALRWAIEDRDPTPRDLRNTFSAPPWRLTVIPLVLWGCWRGVADHPVRLSRHRIHPEDVVRDHVQRDRGVGQLLLLYRIRAAAGGCAGPRKR